MYCQGQILHLTEAATGGETGTDPSDPSDELFPGVLFGLKVEEIMTHFAQSDEAKKDYAELQWQRFSEVLDQLKAANMLPPLVHTCNSGGYLDLPQMHGNMVRIGILPTGVYPSKVCRRVNVDGEKLTPAMKLNAKVMFLKQIKAGDFVGYGMHYQADSDRTIAVIPMGYGDGYPRLRNTGHVLIRGQKAPIRGGVCMDAMMVDVTEIPGVSVGDEVTLLGQDQEETLSAMMLADWAGTTTYGILAGWTPRLEYVYVD